MRVTDYTVQSQWDFRQMLFGIYWGSQNKALYLGPLAVRWMKIPPLEEFLADLEELPEHDFVPVEGELGKYECTGCGEVRYDPAVN